MAAPLTARQAWRRPRRIPSSTGDPPCAARARSRIRATTIRPSCSTMKCTPPNAFARSCSVNSASLFLQAASNRSRSAATSSARRSSLATRRTIAMERTYRAVGARTWPSQPASGLVTSGGLVCLLAYRVGCWESPRNETIERPSGDGYVAPIESTLDARRGEPSLRFQNKKVSARATALVLALGVVGVLVTALPASASTITSFTPTCGVSPERWSPSTVATSHGMTRRPVQRYVLNGEVFVSRRPGDRDGACAAPRRGRSSSTTAARSTPRARRTSSRLAAGVPTITSFTPTRRSGRDESSIITGTNFGCTTSVLFNTTAATTYVVNSATQITATVPTGATTGPLHVTTSGGGPREQRHQLHAWSRHRRSRRSRRRAGRWARASPSPARTSPG